MTNPDRPEVMRAAVARLKQLFSRNGIDRMPADSILFHAATDMLAMERERCAQIAESDEFYGSATQHAIAAAIRGSKVTR
jgi:hypothetical protein